MPHVSPTKVRKFLTSREFDVLSALGDSGYYLLVDHIDGADWAAREAAVETSGWKVDLIVGQIKEMRALISALRDEQEATQGKEWFLTDAEQNADYTAQVEKVYELNSLCYYRAIFSAAADRGE